MQDCYEKHPLFFGNNPKNAGEDATDSISPSLQRKGARAGKANVPARHASFRLFVAHSLTIFASENASIKQENLRFLQQELQTEFFHLCLGG